MDTFSSRKPNSGSSILSWSLVLIYLLSIIGIEVSLLQGINPGWGILVYGLMLVGLIVFAALEPDDSLVFISMSGLPIIRIIGYGVPFSNTTLTVHFAITGLILLFYIVPLVRMPEIAEYKILKIPQNWLAQVFVIASGVIVGYYQYSVFPQNTIDFQSALELVTFVAAIGLLAFVEEIIFRGVLLTGFAKRFSDSASILFSALLYTSMFIPFGSVGVIFIIFLVSLFYGLVSLRISGLYGVIGAHFISSLFYYLIFTIP